MNNNDLPSDNFLKNLHPAPDPGCVADLEVLDNGHIVALFPYWIMLLTPNGRVLSSINLQKKSISLGRFADAFVVTCVSEWLCFVRIVDSELDIFRRMKTKMQFTGACALTTDSLMCVAEDEPTVYVFNGRGTCVRTIDLGSYGMDLPHRKSSRRIRQNLIGNVVVSDYRNNSVLILSNKEKHAVIHCIDCPSNIAVCGKYLYIAQDAYANIVFDVCLDDQRKLLMLEDVDGIHKPTSVTVNRHGIMMIGMQSSESVGKKYQIPYNVV